MNKVFVLGYGNDKISTSSSVALFAGIEYKTVYKTVSAPIIPNSFIKYKKKTPNIKEQ